MFKGCSCTNVYGLPDCGRVSERMQGEATVPYDPQADKWV